MLRELFYLRRLRRRRITFSADCGFDLYGNFSDRSVLQVDNEMSESDTKNILERIEQLERLVAETRLPDEAIVGANYVALLFDCSAEAVVRGRFGTDRIPRIREKPVGFKKSEVHRVLREMKTPVSERAAEVRSKTRPIKRRRSIITKKAA